MELLLPLLAALLVGAGVFLLLSRALIRLILGLVLLSYGANLAILLSSTDFTPLAPPLLDRPGPYTDPLPQALILTAIVISFGTTSLLVVLAMKVYRATGTDHVPELLGPHDLPEPRLRYADPESPSVSPEHGPTERPGRDA